MIWKDRLTSLENLPHLRTQEGTQVEHSVGKVCFPQRAEIIMEYQNRGESLVLIIMMTIFTYIY